MQSDNFKKFHFICSVITAKTTLYMVVVHCVHVSVFVPLSGVQFCLCSQLTVMVLCIFSVHLFDYEVLNGATETDGLLGPSLAVSHFHNINVVFPIFRNHRHAPSTAAPYTQSTQLASGNSQEAPSQVAKNKKLSIRIIKNAFYDERHSCIRACARPHLMFAAYCKLSNSMVYARENTSAVCLIIISIFPYRN